MISFPRLAIALSAVALSMTACNMTNIQPVMDTLTPLGKQWLLEDIGGAGVMDIAQTTLSFDQTGNVSGSGGCNIYSGGSHIDDLSLSFKPMAATKKACPEAIMNQETKYFQAMAKVAGYEMNESTLKFVDSAGRHLLKFSKM